MSAMWWPDIKGCAVRIPLQLVLLMVGAAPLQAADLSDTFLSVHRAAIHLWLARHPHYRLAVTEDCQCEEDIESIRSGSIGPWKPVASYEPYLAEADFTGDGNKDLAVVVLPTNAEGTVLVLVSSAAEQDSVAEPVEIPRDGTSVRGRGLFVRPPSSGNCRWLLLFGAFESEADELAINY